MNNRAKNLIFIGIFIVCLGLVFLVLVLTQPKQEDDSSKTNTNTELIEIISGNKDDIASMTIKNSYGEFTVTQNAKGFYVDELKDLRQNNTTLAAAGNCVSTIKAQALVEENASDMDKYGLSDANPTASAEVRRKDGSSYKVYFGIDAPDGRSVYVRMSDSKDVYTVLATSARYFYNSKESFISVIIMNQISSENVAPTIDLLTIKRKDLDYDIVFEDDTKNYAIDDVSMASSQVMISPVYAYLDIVNSNSIIYGLWGLTAVEAIKPFPTEEDMAEYGLTDPFCSVVLNAELQTYKLSIGNVAEYAYDENGNSTSEPAYFYGYFDGIDVIFKFQASDVPWATFMPIDILSSLMTSNYIYALDYIDVELHNGEDVNYYFDVTAEEDKSVLECNLDGQPTDIEAFKILYQYFLKCPIDALCLEDPAEDAKLLAKVHFERAVGGGDTLEFYDGGANRVIIKLNGTTSFSQPKSYLDVLGANIKLFKEGASGDDLQMIW